MDLAGSEALQALPGGPSKIHAIVSKTLVTGDNIANLTGGGGGGFAKPLNLTNPLLEYFSEDELWRVSLVTVCLLLALGVFIYMIAHEDARCKLLF